MRPSIPAARGRFRAILYVALGIFIVADIALLAVFLNGLGGSRPGSLPTLAALAARPTQAPSATPLPPTSTTQPTPAATVTLPPLDVDIEGILAGMSLEQKAGQMVIAVLPGRSADQEARDLIRGRQIGGLVLFDVNISDPQQTFTLTQDVQALAAGSKPAIPLLLAVDNEGGRVYQFTSGVTQFPAQMAIGAANSTDLAYQSALASARELRALGINTNLSPVLDVNTDPNNAIIGLRSFGDSPERVAEMGAAYIAGLQYGGVIAVPKHFPGHGDTSVDSHRDIPQINRSEAELEAREFIPFHRAVQMQVPALMVGHIANQIIDPQGLPASLSPALNTDLLRKVFGYQGVIMTDSLTMVPIRTAYSVEEYTMRAVAAGSDMLMYTNPAAALVGQKTIMDAAQSSGPAMEALDASVRRILTMKARLGLFKPRPTELAQFPMPGNADLALQIARKAIYAQGAASFPLIKTGRVLLITPAALPKGSVEGDNLSMLGELLEQRGLDVDEWILPSDTSPEFAAIRERVMKDLPEYPVVIFVTANAVMGSPVLHSPQSMMVQDVYASGIPTILVASSLPYDLKLAPPGQPALATFGDIPIQIQALAEALLADTAPTGVLPVEIK